MKSIFKILMTFAGIALAMSLQAQSNSGLTPFAGSTHAYHVDQSSLTNTTLTWSVVGGVAADYEFVGGVTTGEDVSVKWNTANTYTLKVEEKRTDLDVALAGCPTTRTISVVVGGNSFDIFAELVSDANTCATVVNLVVDVDGLGGLGENSDDTFGTTTRVYNVKMTGGDPAKTWKFDYALTDIATNHDLTDVTFAVAGNVSVAGSTVNMAAGATTAILTVTYSTNKNTSGTNGQDPDFNLVLTVTNGLDELGTPDSDVTAASNIMTYSVKAVPATTGITTN